VYSGVVAGGVRGGTPPDQAMDQRLVFGFAVAFGFGFALAIGFGFGFGFGVEVMITSKGSVNVIDGTQTVPASCR
jgi:hypothetical protein